MGLMRGSSRKFGALIATDPSQSDNGLVHICDDRCTSETSSGEVLNKNRRSSRKGAVVGNVVEGVEGRERKMGAWKTQS